jgi:hypothetical protein
MSKLTKAQIEELVQKNKEKIKIDLAAARKLFQEVHQPGPVNPKLQEFYDRVEPVIIVDKHGNSIPRPTTPQLEEFCRFHNTLFFDVHFPPCDDSLYKMEDRKLEIPLSKRPPIVWKRPPEFFKKAGSDEAEFFLFENIEPNDIKQGLLGDCWSVNS